ncbi:MAG: SEC-C metal-binding domain-containing protein, partial [Myxococcota bacterium]|nr:SEC-C metal-binding domain-containing protein [Myxococcota bacterium]
MPPTTRTTIGRNEPCPCGSQEKYKRCCLPRHERARRATLEVRRKALASGDPEAVVGAHLDSLSRAVAHARSLLDAGRSAEAEGAARSVLRQFPGEVDGYELLAAVHEARGDIAGALRSWRMAHAHVQVVGDYPPEAAEEFQREIERLLPDIPGLRAIRGFIFHSPPAALGEVGGGRTGWTGSRAVRRCDGPWAEAVPAGAGWVRRL